MRQRVSVSENLYPYSLHSLIEVSAKAWHAILYLVTVTPWQYPPRLGMVFYILSRLGSIRQGLACLSRLGSIRLGLACWATLPLAKVRSVSPVRRRRMGSLSHWDTAWPLGPETVTGPASMIRACRCPPRLASRRRITGGGLATRMRPWSRRSWFSSCFTHGQGHALACNRQGL